MEATNQRVNTDAERLKVLYLERAGGLTQKEFGLNYGIGSQGMVWQYLNNKRPLNAGVALKFANALGVPIGAFSPTLAEQIASGGKVEIQRVGISIQIRPELRGEMQVLLARRNKGLRITKTYELYEEAIAEFIAKHQL